MPNKKSGGKKNSSGGSPKKLLLLVLVAVVAFAAKKCKSGGELPAGLSEIVSTVTQNAENENATVSGSSSQTSQNQQTSAKKGVIALPKNLEIPICDGTSGKKDHQRRDFKHYSLCYRESYEQAEWSAYSLSKNQLVKNAKRSDDFREDPEIKTGSATLADYKGSGYDRGHLTPAADMAFSQEAMSETFYMSNMSPQARAFNQGIWRLLEAQVRVWAEKFGRVYVVSGPIFDKKPSELKKIGKSNVSVPERYYKVILVPIYKNDADAKSADDAENVMAIGFVFPNDACKGKKFWDFATSVSEVEKATGLDFFSKLEDSAEKKAEKSFDLELWK